MRWLIVFVLTCLVWNGLQPWLERFGLGRVPGDFSVRVGRRRWHFPLGSSLLITLVGLALMRWL